MSILIVSELIRRYGDDLMFFQVAYHWRFNKDIDVWGDVLAWRTQKTIPQYVHEFISATGTKGG